MNKEEFLTFNIGILILLFSIGIVGAVLGLVLPNTTTSWFWFGLSGVSLLGIILDYFKLKFGYFDK